MKEITAKEYCYIFKEYLDKGEPLSIISTFTDMEGSNPFGYGCPALDTVWGLNGNGIVKVESKKESESNDWDYKYYKI